MTPLQRYKFDQENNGFQQDPNQENAIILLQNLFDEILISNNKTLSFFEKLLITLKLKQPQISTIKGLYFWGGVGRGKTYLMDSFFHALPIEKKQRMHFHRFMQRIHAERAAQNDLVDPIKKIGEELAKNCRVLCFDEFVVSDVADAVILARLMDVLFKNNVILIATSNVEPVNLYKNGLQRDLFLPAIDLIYTHTQVVNIDSGIDYRLLFLDKAKIYFSPLNAEANQGLEHNFKSLAVEEGSENGQININNRDIKFIKRAEGIIWFEFLELCDGPRSQQDYIELAKCFHTVFIANIPIMDKLMEDQARRFINLIDVLYDHNVKIIISAAAQAEELYQGFRVKFEFERTISRLQEMQSHDYLTLEHIS